MKFDGKALAREIEEKVGLKVAQMLTVPKIVSFLVGEDPASERYTAMKSQVAEWMGIDFEVVRLASTRQHVSTELKQMIVEVGARSDVTGVMVQLPVPGLQGDSLQDVLSAIPQKKDVDGLLWEKSGVMPATVRAILTILERIANNQSPIINKQTNGDLWKKKFVVVGARGAVGRPLAVELKKRGVEVVEVEFDTPEPTRMILEGEVVISCVGKKGLVKGEMVRDRVIAIDVGGDMTPEVYQKASISLEVPGGVGPVTVACLMQNVLEII